MMIQPYVENAIYHGLMHKERKGELVIQFQTNGERLHCTIIDNGVGREKAKAFKKKNHQSRGMSMTKDRMEALNFIDNFNILVQIKDLNTNEKETGTIVQISFPIDG